MELLAQNRNFFGKSCGSKGYYDWHDPELALKQCLPAVTDGLEKCCLKHGRGCKFDGWAECFNYSAWLEAFRASGIEPEFYANRPRDKEEVLPGPILMGVTTAFLRRSMKRL